MPPYDITRPTTAVRRLNDARARLDAALLELGDATRQYGEATNDAAETLVRMIGERDAQLQAAGDDDG